MNKSPKFSFAVLILLILFLTWAIPSKVKTGDSNVVQVPILSSASQSYLADSNGAIVENLYVSFIFELETFPDLLATVFNSDVEHNNGISFTVDRLGDLYLSIGSIEQRSGVEQRLLVMKMIQPGVPTLVETTFDYPSRQLSVIVNGNSVALLPSDPARVFLFDDCLVHVGLVQVLGRTDNQFEGEISDFTMRFSIGERVLSLINLRLFVLMVGVLIAVSMAKRTNSSL